MKKGKNALIIFIFLVLALLIFLVLVPGAIKENGEMENEVNNENTNLEVDEEGDSQIEDNANLEEEEVSTEFTEVDLQELREDQVRNQIDTYSPVKEEGIDGFDVTNISWTGDNVAEVEYEGNEKHKVEIEFAEGEPTIILATQMPTEQVDVVGEDIVDEDIE